MGREESRNILFFLFKIDYGQDQQSIWVSTSNSDIKNWSLTGAVAADNLKIKKSKIINSEEDEDEMEDEEDDYREHKVLNEKPLKLIKGGTSIKQYHVLNDKRYIIAKDTNDNIFVFDVLKVVCLSSLFTLLKLSFF